MDEKVTKTIDKVAKRPIDLRLIHPKAEPILILSLDRSKVMKEVPSMFKIDKVIEKSEPFSRICFHNGTQGWVRTKFIREV